MKPQLQKIKIELPLLLPCAKDHCVEKLLNILQNEKGIEEAHLDNKSDMVYICVHYNPVYLIPARIQKIIEKAGVEVKNRYRHDVFELQAMDCHICAEVLEHSLSRLNGVLMVSVNYATERLRIDYDNEKTSRKQIQERIKALGYDIVSEGGQKSWFMKNRELLFSIMCGLFLIAAVLTGYFNSGEIIVFAMFGFSYIVGSFFALLDSLKTLKKGRFDIEFLMLVAAFGAAIIGKLQEGALLLFLFSLGHSLEHFAMDKARESIKALSRIAPKKATTIKDDKEFSVPVEDLKKGDFVVVRPGDYIPADGRIIDGFSYINQSAITGEHMPVEKGKNDNVFAGTVNGNGSLKVEVMKLSKESILSRVMKMIDEAQASKSPSQVFSERFEKIFVPVILIGIVLLIAIPLLSGEDINRTLYRAISILVATSPCALAIATPSAILAGIARAARDGVLVKGGVHLENLGRINAVAFDKTGTITKGEPQIKEIRNYGLYSVNQVIQMAASVEKDCSHPIARTLIREAESRGIESLASEKTEIIPGFGLFSIINGEKNIIGKLSFFEKNSDMPEKEIIDKACDMENNGQTTVLLKKGNEFSGIIGVSDMPRDNAKQTIERLRKIGIKKTAILTGDNSRTARMIGNEIGIDDVYSDLLPDEKVNIVSELVRLYETVAMVGDGINDAPAMARSTVGIAMGGAGSDAALETSDIALMADNLLKIPFIIGLGRFVSRVIKQNIVISLGTIAMLVVGVISGWVGISFAVIAHEGSTVLVVLNALSILRFKENV